MKRKYFFMAVAMIGMAFSSVNAQSKHPRIDFGALPAIAYDSDLGFRYGALTNLYFRGDLDKPWYKHSLYLEWSHTTKGSDLKQLKYDSEYLIPGVRVTALARLETEQAMDFYGFNGFQALYDPLIVDTISRMYYRMDRRSLRLMADFQGPVIGRKLRWLAGVAHYNLTMGSVDLEKLNKGKDEADKIPDVDGLYENYVKWGVIPANQATGGTSTFLKLGLVADTRDNEPNPYHGIWTEALLIAAPGFLWNDSPYSVLVITHRQYFTLIKERLTFAYRLNYQTTLTGHQPWYMLNWRHSSFNNVEGLGGSKTLRGILRDRILAEGAVMGNFEFRWRFLYFNFLGDRWYLALSPFLDAARVTKPYSVDMVPEMLQGDTDSWHLGYGAGLHIAWGDNFIIAVDYGLAADKRDGKSGLYIGLDFLY